MARANRYFIPGQVWHITHRCHQKSFLLALATDRQNWIHWLLEARERYRLCVLNYIVTCNHVHLLVVDGGDQGIPKSLQLIAGCTAQAFNRREGRRGAFWEDRYHATAVAADRHLMRCLVYVDLNMVRAGAVSHPSEWPESGYNEIQAANVKHPVIDLSTLGGLLGFTDAEQLRREHRQWVATALGEQPRRETCWTESIAVGGREYVEDIGRQLGVESRRRAVVSQGGLYTLREQPGAYDAVPQRK